MSKGAIVIALCALAHARASAPFIQTAAARSVENQMKSKAETVKKIIRLLAFGWILFFVPLAFAQDLPKEIRGYKVYQTKISIKNQSEKSGSGKSAKNEAMEAFVKVSEPEFAEVNLTGITFELTADIEIPEQSGRIDFLTFKDFRVNDLAVEIEEYKSTFEFKKNETISLPKPVKIFVGADQTLRGAWSEAFESKEEWTVTGRVFVFGRFKKAGFKFKRVVPVDVSLKIKNPLLSSESRL